MIFSGQNTDTVEVDVTGSADGSITLKCEASNGNGEAAQDITQFATSHDDTVVAITFDGPNIGNQTLTIDVPFSLDVSPRYSGTITGYSLVGGWPPGFTITSGGVISGTTTSETFYANLSVLSTNAVDSASSDTFSINSVPDVPVFNGTIANMVGDQGVPIATYDASLHFQTGGAVSAYTLTGTGVPWMTIGSSSGVISGTPTDGTDYTGVTVTGTNASGSDTSNGFAVTIEGDVPPVTSEGIMIIYAL